MRLCETPPAHVFKITDFFLPPPFFQPEYDLIRWPDINRPAALSRVRWLRLGRARSPISAHINILEVRLLKGAGWVDRNGRTWPRDRLVKKIIYKWNTTWHLPDSIGAVNTIEAFRCRWQELEGRRNVIQGGLRTLHMCAILHDSGCVSTCVPIRAANHLWIFATIAFWRTEATVENR